MVKEETKQIAQFIFFILSLFFMIFDFVWCVVFVRYGDHVKYDLDTVVTIQLVIGLILFGATLIFGIIAVWKAILQQMRDKIVEELEQEKKRIMAR